MLRKTSSLLLCLLAGSFTASAQSNYALIRGAISDPHHRAVPGAHIHLKSVGTGAEREVIANEAGQYEIAGLQPGSYELDVDIRGFKPSEQKIDLEVGQHATIDVEMTVEGGTQTVQVQASQGELLKTEDASV